MASTRKASIAAEIRADRSRFKADLAEAKADSRFFRAKVLEDFAAVEKGISMRGSLKQTAAEFQRMEQGMNRVKSAAESASVFMGMFQQETTRARLEAERAAEAAQRIGVRPVQQQITGLKLRADSAPAIAQRQAAADAAWTDPAFVQRTRAQIQGLTRDTLTANTAMMQGGKGATNAGMGMLMLSQTLDDAQYGFRGIVNNIAPLVMAFGGSTGLAGVLTIVAVGFNLLGDAAVKAWNKMTGEEDYQKVLARNEELKAAHERRLQAMIDGAREQAKAEADLAQEVEQATDRRIEAMQREMDHRREMQRLDAEIAKQGLAGGSDGRRTVRGAAIDQDAAAKDLATRERFYREQMQNSEADQKAAEKRLAELKEERNALNDLKRRREVEGYEKPLTAKDEARLAGLNGQVDAAQTAVDAGAARRRGFQSQLQGIANERQQLEKENQLRELRVQQELRQQGEEMAKTGFRAVHGFLENLNTRAKEANEANRKAWQTEKERGEKEQRMADERTKLEIETLRSGGKTKQADALQKKLDLEGNTRALIAKGFDPEEAAAMAAQGQRNADQQARLQDRRAGRRTIKGAVSKNLKTGIDGDWHSGMGSSDFFNHGIGYNFDQQKTPLNNALGAANRRLKAAEAAGGANSPEALAMREMKDGILAKLDQLIEASTKPVAEKTAPKRN